MHFLVNCRTSLEYKQRQQSGAKRYSKGMQIYMLVKI
jgi:hypothetical protein